MALYDAVTTGDRRVALLALRDHLGAAIDECGSMRDLAALSRQLTDVLSQIEALPDASEVSAADEIAARRSSRRSNPTGKPRAKRSG